MAAQDRLLRATEYGEITRIGASKPISVDVRIVAATNENLPALVDQGKFRADLLDRLSFEVITLPPLRARQGDVPLLAEHFGRRMAVELDWANWPGFSAARDAPSWRPIAGPATCANCATWSSARCIGTRTRSGRSTRSTSTRSIRRGRRPSVSFAAPAPAVESDEPSRRILLAPPAAASSDFRASIADYERQLLEDALRRNRFNQRATAAALNLSYDQLRHALKRHKLQDSAA